MSAIPRALELVARPTSDDVAAMIDVVLEEGLDVEDHWPAVHQRQ